MGTFFYVRITDCHAPKGARSDSAIRNNSQTFSVIAKPVSQHWLWQSAPQRIFTDCHGSTTLAVTAIIETFPNLSPSLRSLQRKLWRPRTKSAEVPMGAISFPIGLLSLVGSHTEGRQPFHRWTFRGLVYTYCNKSSVFFCKHMNTIWNCCGCFECTAIACQMVLF